MLTRLALASLLLFSPVLAASSPLVESVDAPIDFANVEHPESHLTKRSPVLTYALYTLDSKLWKTSWGTIGIGSNFFFVADTSTSDLVVQQTSEAAVSPTYTSAHRNITLSYSTGNVTAAVGSATISSSPARISGQAIGVTSGPIYKNSSAFSSPAAVGGVLGLGFPEQSKLGRPTLLSNLVASGTISAAKFTLFLASSLSCSRLFIGGGPASFLVNGTGIRVPVITGADSWSLEITNYITGSTNKLLYTSALLDSASPITYLPRAAAAAIFGAIPGASLASSTTRTLYGTSYPVDLYQYPCDTAVTPSFVFTGGKRQLVKFAEQYLDEGYPAHKGWGGLCQAGIVGVDLDGGKKAILGNNFLRNYLTTFDFADPLYSAKPTVTFLTKSWNATNDDVSNDFMNPVGHHCSTTIYGNQ